MVKVVEKKTRVQFDLPGRSMKRLMSLKLRTEATSYTEVAKEAFKLYEDMLTRKEENRPFYVKQDGVFVEYPGVLGA